MSPAGGDGSTKSSAVVRRVRSISRTLWSSTQRNPAEGTNVPRPTTMLAWSSVRESDSGSGAIASIRCRSASASKPAESARASVCGATMRSSDSAARPTSTNGAICRMGCTFAVGAMRRTCVSRNFERA